MYSVADFLGEVTDTGLIRDTAVDHVIKNLTAVSAVSFEHAHFIHIVGVGKRGAY